MHALGETERKEEKSNHNRPRGEAILRQTTRIADSHGNVATSLPLFFILMSISVTRVFAGDLSLSLPTPSLL